MTGKEMIINCGVTQSSIMGPTLFILFINNTCDLNMHGQIITYVDKMCLLFSDAS